MSRQPWPTRRRSPLLVAVPYSYALTEHKPLLRAYKWGILARLAGVYRVDVILLYQSADKPAPRRVREEARLILEYLVTAPYLRRRLFPLHPALRYAGALPPLQLPTHGVGGPRPGECREALVLEAGERWALVEAGLGRPVRLETAGRRRPGERLLVRLESLEPPRLSEGCSPPPYAGYRVEEVGSLAEALAAARRRGLRVVLTSRLGVPATPGLLSRLARGARGLAVFFGSPWSGLPRLAELEGVSLEGAGPPLNTVPRQGTLTVRVEEAVAATLALLNLFTE